MKRVAAYARVSTDSEEQLTSYEAQVDYYTKYIKERADVHFRPKSSALNTAATMVRRSAVPTPNTAVQSGGAMKSTKTGNLVQHHILQKMKLSKGFWRHLIF